MTILPAPLLSDVLVAATETADALGENALIDIPLDVLMWLSELVEKHPEYQVGAYLSDELIRIAAGE